MNDRIRTIVVLVLALGAAGLTYRFLSGVKETTTVVMASAEIPAGQPITSDMLSTVTVARQEQERLAPLAVHDPSEVVGRASKRPIRKDTVLTRDPDTFRLPQEALEKATGGTVPPAYLIPPGLVAIALPVDADSAVGYSLQKSDFVQVIWTGTRDKEIIVRTILGRALVFDTGREQSLGLGAQDQGFRTVTIVVSPDEAERVALAKRSGKVDLALIGK